MTTTLELPTETPAIVNGMPSQELQTIATKVVNGERLSREDGLFLFATEHRQAVLDLADHARKMRAGDTVYFATTQYIHPTNLCELSCPMCSFYAKPGWDSAWFMTPDQIEEKIREHQGLGVKEIHVVGGLWRDCDLDYYQEMFTRIKNIDPNLHIKALTPVEYDFLATQHNIPVEEVFERMISWGLGSLPGGGAEILVEEIRTQVAPQKIDSTRYMEIHEIAHNLGLRSNITMLFGHVEDECHIIDHLEWVRKLQDKTNGFFTFVPLRYHDENNALGKRKKRLKPKDVPLVFAISRLMLDNVNNLKALWGYLGVDLALETLQCGANDFSSAAIDEKVITMAGGVKLKMNYDTMSHLVEGIGRIPKNIHSGYDYSQDLPSGSVL